MGDCRDPGQLLGSGEFRQGESGELGGWFQSRSEAGKGLEKEQEKVNIKSSTFLGLGSSQGAGVAVASRSQNGETWAQSRKAWVHLPTGFRLRKRTEVVTRHPSSQASGAPGGGGVHLGPGPATPSHAHHSQERLFPAPHRALEVRFLQRPRVTGTDGSSCSAGAGKRPLALVSKGEWRGG